VARTTGSIDISFDAISISVVHNMPLIDMSLEDFMAPITDACRTHL
jgi:3-oxoacyl-[acyl-carrier protein] reductase